MKKFMSFVMIVLIVVVIVVGSVATFMTYSSYDNKMAATYDEKGREYTTSSSQLESDNYRYIKREEYQIVRKSENLKRTIKAKELLLTRAKQNYNIDRTTNNYNQYMSAESELLTAQLNYSSFKQNTTAVVLTSFFGTYFIFVVLLSVGLVINTRRGRNHD